MDAGGAQIRCGHDSVPADDVVEGVQGVNGAHSLTQKGCFVLVQVEIRQDVDP
jgi:hypothetical protein